MVLLRESRIVQHLIDGIKDTVLIELISNKRTETEFVGTIFSTIFNKNSQMRDRNSVFKMISERLQSSILTLPKTNSK
jgi:hypothetical protein